MRARAEVCVFPSTAMVRVPVGVVVTELDADATVIVIVSCSPSEGVVVAAERVVVEAAPDDVEVGQAIRRL